MYPVNPKGTQVIVGSMNMGYISDTARNRTHNLFRTKREPIPLGHSDGQEVKGQNQTRKTSKSNISKTVRDREMVSIEVK